MPRGAQVVVEGKAAIGENSIQFGCDLRKQPHDAWTICSRLPRSAPAESSAIEVPWIDRELNIAGFWVQDGWFCAEQLFLDKYVGPFFLANTNIKLVGIGDFIGTFDQKHISVKYDAIDLILESDNFVINIPHIAQTVESKTLIGVHDFDLVKGQSYGFLPANHATYFEKNSGLLFTDIHAQIFFEDNKIRIPEIEAFCTGLYFAGDILVDMSHQKESIYDVGVHTHTISGKLSQLMHLFAHFEQSPVFSKLPLEGNLNYRQKRSSFKI